jgi:hypothetical protein
MTLPTTLPVWIDELARHGITVLPPSTAVPVELYAALPDGRGLHFQCRGTRVTLRLFAPESVRLAVPVHESTPTELPLLTEVWLPFQPVPQTQHHPVRVVLSGAPVASASVDGGARFGWTGHEAGLLRAAQARPLFDELLAGLVPDLALVAA